MKSSERRAGNLSRKRRKERRRWPSNGCQRVSRVGCNGSPDSTRSFRNRTSQLARCQNNEMGIHPFIHFFDTKLSDPVRSTGQKLHSRVPVKPRRLLRFWCIIETASSMMRTGDFSRYLTSHVYFEHGGRSMAKFQPPFTLRRPSREACSRR